MRDFSDFMREDGESKGRDFTKKSGNPAPWGPTVYPEGTVLDLTKKSMVSAQALRPESDQDKARRKLEESKRVLANGNRGGLSKEGSAAAMQYVQRKLKKLIPRKNSI